ncbi:hypothetical protein HERIO_1584 [Hepatospora eriocheir]|uniref:Uncharacterized protein n=1 Tax=Hepatospora eriocheir TaxID=1081669 RepID=A0A1X0Q9N2_9MICR|nr:hypothetical protein HERIO_1584 [Hepatospora eriocheir]
MASFEFKFTNKFYFKGHLMQNNSNIIFYNNLIFPVNNLTQIVHTDTFVYFQNRDGIFRINDKFNLFDNTPLYVNNRFKLIDAGSECVLIRSNDFYLLHFDDNTIVNLTEFDLHHHLIIYLSYLVVFTDNMITFYNYKNIRDEESYISDFKIIGVEKIMINENMFLKVIQPSGEFEFFYGNILITDVNVLYLQNSTTIKSNASCVALETQMSLVKSPYKLIQESLPSDTSMLSENTNNHKNNYSLYKREHFYDPSVLEVSHNCAYKVIRKILNIKRNKKEKENTFPKIVKRGKLTKKKSNKKFNEIITDILLQCKATLAVDVNDTDQIRSKLFAARLLATNILPFIKTDCELRFTPCDFKVNSTLVPLSNDSIFLLSFIAPVNKSVYTHTARSYSGFIFGSNDYTSSSEADMLVYLSTITKGILSNHLVPSENMINRLHIGMGFEPFRKYIIFVLSTFDKISNWFLVQDIKKQVVGVNINIIGIAIKNFNTCNRLILKELFDIYYNDEIKTSFRDTKFLIGLSIFLINNNPDKFIGFSDDNTLASRFINPRTDYVESSAMRDIEVFYMRLFYNIGDNYNIIDCILTDEEYFNDKKQFEIAADVFYVAIYIINNYENIELKNIEELLKRIYEMIDLYENMDSNIVYDYLLISYSLIIKLYDFDQIYAIRILRRKLIDFDSAACKKFLGRNVMTKIYGSGFESTSNYKNLLSILLSDYKIAINDYTYKICIVLFIYTNSQETQTTEIEFFKQFAISKLLNYKEEVACDKVTKKTLKKNLYKRMNNDYDRKYLVDVLSDFLENYTDNFENNKGKQYHITDNAIEYLIGEFNKF